MRGEASVPRLRSFPRGQPRPSRTLPNCRRHKTRNWLDNVTPIGAGGPGRATAQVYPTLAKDFFHLHADSLADGIARMPRRSPVDGTPATSGVLSDVRRDVLWRAAWRPGRACRSPCPARPSRDGSRVPSARPSTVGTTAHSAVPLAVVTRKSTNRPCRFSITACPT